MLNAFLAQPGYSYHADGRVEAMVQPLPAEVPIALTFNGTTQAVMMATPQDLEDFIYGFALSEGIAQSHEIEDIAIVPTDLGIDVQAWVNTEVQDRLVTRRRKMIGPVGCGLCGIDSIEAAIRPPPAVLGNEFRLTSAEILTAIARLPDHQPLHDQTRAAHCAGFWHDHHIHTSREDIGRHNALDKLIGALHRRNTLGHNGAVLLTSRVSTDMVQKVAAFGAPMIIAVSAPTLAAITLADQLNITLIAQAKRDRFHAYSHFHRIGS